MNPVNPKRFHWENLKFPAIIMGSIVVLGVSITFALNYYGQKKEIENYRVGPWSIAHCPFPLGFRSTLQRYRPDVPWKMAQEINRELGPKLGYSVPVYVKASKVSPGSVVVSVRASRPPERGEGNSCRIPNLGPTAPVDATSLAMGFFHFKVLKAGKRLVGGTVVMCDRKFKKMVGLFKKPKWLRLYPGYWERYVKHELMHPIIGAGHPNWHLDVTHENAPQQSISGGVVKILKRIYDPFCKKK